MSMREKAEEFAALHADEKRDMQVMPIAYLAGYRQAIEDAAKIAKTWGYTFDENAHQPWAKEANLALRSQNLEIEERIRALAKEDGK